MLIRKMVLTQIYFLYKRLNHILINVNVVNVKYATIFNNVKKNKRIAHVKLKLKYIFT